MMSVEEVDNLTEILKPYLEIDDFESAITTLEEYEKLNDVFVIYVDKLLRNPKVSEEQKVRIKLLDKAWRKADRKIKLEKLRKLKQGNTNGIHELLLLLDKGTPVEVCNALYEFPNKNEIVRRGWEFMRKAMDRIKTNPDHHKVLEELLKIGIHPEVQQTGMHYSPFTIAQRENMQQVLILFYKFFPELEISNQKSKNDESQPWNLSDAEKSFLEAKEMIDDWENAEEMTVVMENFKKCSQAVNLDYYFYSALYSFYIDGHSNAYLDKQIQSKEYMIWYEHNTTMKLLNEGKLKMATLQAELIRTFVERYNRLGYIERKDYYSHLVEEGENEENFDTHLEKYGGYSMLEENTQATTSQIEYLEKLAGVKFPNELKDFYRTIGSLSGMEDIFAIPSVNKLLTNLKRTDESKLCGLGVKDIILYYWGGFNTILSQDDIDLLNKQYISFGYLQENDSSVYILYFDQQERFGVLYYDQNHPHILEKSLISMLKNSIARKSLSEILMIALVDSSHQAIGGYCSFENLI
ncbi:SMI1/KNR4 family protein [Aquimarina sp. AU58]|uniref:SMI1/KNR4 family protein n=1 Tax=Aquimarina sp. AU58 TaxID=1874112 RepID=UPI00135721A9|nr:SMI1/KNR4 family protein [Aquimarina sp. AU58]